MFVGLARGTDCSASRAIGTHLAPLGGPLATSNEKSTVSIFAALLLQLALLALVIRQFNVESEAFYRVSVLAFAGFVVHSALPLRFRMPFFLALSLAAIWLVFGLASGLTLVGLGLLLVGICHLPVSIRARVALLLAVGGGLALLRAQIVASPIPMAVWPILGSMFMFRLAVYLYDVRTEKAPLSFSKTLSYFFLLPNVCFPLFPVVDYKTFRRTYYNEDAVQIYRKGVRWIVRGVVHLLLYRFVYYHVTISPSQVSDAFDLTRFLIGNFMLYLRVSGQFHVAIGMLHLFGFNLPETHHLYYLASNFNDFWRRINIYWKDFMVKLFYYPMFFRLRRLGPTTALVISTSVVFVSTWLLHSYQWFWLLGSFPITWQDGVFWGVLGVLVILTSLREVRPTQQRRVPLRSPAAQFMWQAARTVGTFAVICVLWSIWTTESLGQWWAMWHLESIGAADLRWPPVLLVGVVAIGVAVNAQAFGLMPSRLQTLQRWWQSPSATIAVLSILLALAQPAVQTSLPWPANSVLPSLRQDRLNTNDAQLLERGYYESLLSVDRFNSQLWELYTLRPAAAAVDFGNTPVFRRTPDFLNGELVPSRQMQFNGATFTTNSSGMRDGEYEQKPAAGTYRMALLGSSHVLGWGVGDDDTFENLVEAKLNETATNRPYRRYEILNFAVGGYGPMQELVSLDRKAFGFDPDAVLFVAHRNDLRRAVGHLISRMKDDVPVPYEGLRQLIRSKGIDENTSEFLVGKQLEPHSREILQWVYRQVVSECRNRGVLPIWVFMPTLEGSREDEDAVDLERMATEAGFVTISLADAYAGHSRESLWVATWDRHPNATGHSLMADALYNALRDMDRTRGLGIFTRDTAAAAAATTGAGRGERTRQ